METREPICPVEARGKARELCGGTAQWELISDRRGSAVWKARGPAGAVAVKVGRGEGAAITSREAAVLERMPHHGGPPPSFGRSQEAAWLITPWYEGPSTWDLFRDVREGRDGFGPARDAAVAVCEAVGALHQAGWVHGDLQPQHFIHTAAGVRLVDCSWAWSPDLSPSYMFRGGLVHLLSPQLAASVEEGIRPVAPTQQDEVYTLASSLWWACTGSWPLDYEAAGVSTGKMTAPELRRIIGEGHVPLASADKPWPSFLGALRATLSAPASQRPTPLQLAAWLRTATVTKSE